MDQPLTGISVRIAITALDEKHITETIAKPATCISDKFSIRTTQNKQFPDRSKLNEVHLHYKQLNELHFWIACTTWKKKN